MSKAEDLAAKLVIPKQVDDIEELCKFYYILGYHQAEKDLELSWEDIRKIVIIYENVLNDKDFNTLPIKDGYTEILKRFNKERKEK